MNIMRKKLGKNGGFTLVEMLIVVAIIAILIAVSIPLVTESLEKSRDATDIANERSAKAEAAMVYLEAVDDPPVEGYPYGPKKETLLKNYTGDMAALSYGDGLWYDAVKGTLEIDAPEAYGKCTGARQCEDSGWLSNGTGVTKTSGQNISHVTKAVRIWYNVTTNQYDIEWQDVA